MRSSTKHSKQVQRVPSAHMIHVPGALPAVPRLKAAPAAQIHTTHLPDPPLPPPPVITCQQCSPCLPPPPATPWAIPLPSHPFRSTANHLPSLHKPAEHHPTSQEGPIHLFAQLCCHPPPPSQHLPPLAWPGPLPCHPTPSTHTDLLISHPPLALSMFPQLPGQHHSHRIP